MRKATPAMINQQYEHIINVLDTQGNQGNE